MTAKIPALLLFGILSKTIGAGQALEVRGLLGQARRSRPVLLCVMAGMPKSISSGGEERLAEIVRAWDMRSSVYGNVEAVAPASMRTFEVPEDDFSLAGMPPAQAFEALVSTFDAGQWQRLGSEEGIGLSEMRDDAQRTLYVATVSKNESILIQSTHDPSQVREVGGGPASRRMRLAKRERVYLSAPRSEGDPMESMVSPKAPDEYQVGRSLPALKLSPNESPLGKSVPNAPKPTQLDLRAEALVVKIAPASLESLATVGDLIGCLRKATGLEIYADARYGRLPILLRAKEAASAGELLRALLASLAATVRRVGPAYVVVDDLRGTGVHQELWRQVRVVHEAKLRQVVADAEGKLAESFSESSLRGDDSSLRLTEAQAEEARKTPAWFGFSILKTTYGALTPAQQQEARQAAALNLPRPLEVLASSRVDLVARADLQLLISGVNAPVALPGAADPLEALATNLRRPAPSPSLPATGSSLIDHLGKFTERIALFDVRTESISPQDCASLKALGFTSIWLEVLVDDLPTSMNANPSRLGAFVSAVRRAGMKAKLLIRPLVRKVGLPEGTYDRTIIESMSSAPSSTIPKDALRVARLSGLSALTGALASIPDLSGVVLAGTAPPGYTTRLGAYGDGVGEPYGYSEESRLRFLRERSIDPIDLPASYPVPSSIALQPSLWGSLDTVTKDAYDAWTLERSRLNEAAIQAFANEIDARGQSLGWQPAFFEQRSLPSGGYWYAGWTGTDAYLPGSSIEGKPAGSERGTDFASLVARNPGLVVGGLQVTGVHGLDTTMISLDRLSGTHCGGVVLDFRPWGQRGTTSTNILSFLRGKASR